MADQAINALPTKTAPTTGDKMLMIGAAEEYQIDYDQLATAILNKLTSKTFTLDQGTKSLVAALNELNSKTLMKENLTVNCDTVANLFTFCTSDSENLPKSVYGILITIIRDANVSVQIFFDTSSIDKCIYIRTKNIGVWGSWNRIQFVAL